MSVCKCMCHAVRVIMSDGSIAYDRMGCECCNLTPEGCIDWLAARDGLFQVEKGKLFIEFMSRTGDRIDWFAPIDKRGASWLLAYLVNFAREAEGDE